jgi:hypothetical protein
MAEVSPYLVDAALLRHSHPVLDFGEGLLDRIEVRRVFGQEPEPGAGRLDGVADGFALVAAEIVHDDNVAGLQSWEQLLVDIGAEAFAIDGAIEDARRREAVAAECAQEGQGAPASLRRKVTQSLAFATPAAQRRYIGPDPGLIDEDETVRIEATLPGLPPPSPARDVGANLLSGEQCFF